MGRQKITQQLRFSFINVDLDFPGIRKRYTFDTESIDIDAMELVLYL